MPIHSRRFGTEVTGISILKSVNIKSEITKHRNMHSTF